MATSTIARKSIAACLPPPGATLRPFLDGKRGVTFGSADAGLLVKVEKGTLEVFVERVD
jgi:hypothetical protein